MQTALRSTFVNHGIEALAYRLDEASHGAITELLGLYNPSLGPVRKTGTFFGGAAAFPTGVGHVEYYDIDHVLRRITGASSLDTELESSLFAGGKGVTLHEMLISSLGEVAERLLGALHYFRMDKLHYHGTYKELTSRGIRCAGPDELALFSPEQYAEPDFLFESFTDASWLVWSVGRRLFGGEEVAVPSQLVEMFYAYHRDEAFIGYSVSGGLSSHVSRTHALYHGITELIERDAVNLRWHCRLPPPRIEIDRPPETPDLQRLWRRSAGRPGEFALYYQSVDFPEVPVVTAVQIDDWRRRHAYYSGGGGDLTIEGAMLKALNELGQADRCIAPVLLCPQRGYARASEHLFSLEADDPISKIDLFFKVVGWYGHRQNLPKLSWYLDSGETVPLSSLPQVAYPSMQAQFAALSDALRSRGIDPIVFDMTPPGFRHLKLMKVFIPELTQAFLQSRPAFGHPRFATAPQHLGHRAEPMPYEELVRDPVPYP